MEKQTIALNNRGTGTSAEEVEVEIVDGRIDVTIAFSEDGWTRYLGASPTPQEARALAAVLVQATEEVESRE